MTQSLRWRIDSRIDLQKVSLNDSNRRSIQRADARPVRIEVLHGQASAVP